MAGRLAGTGVARAPGDTPPHGALNGEGAWHTAALGNPTGMDRRRGDRRRCSTPMGERGIRCCDCGRISFSAVASIVVQKFRCISCEGLMHTERRGHGDRRGTALQATG